MNIGDTLHRAILAIAAVIIGIPGIRLLFGTSGYVDGKDNLALTPDLYSELRAMGAVFLAVAVVCVAGAAIGRMRGAATLVGLVGFLPQGVARLVSQSIDGDQHESYLRAGIVEVVIGALLAVLAMRYLSGDSPDANRS